MKKRKLLLAQLALFSFLIAAMVLAQSSRLTGRVMDSSGLVMPGVPIKLYQDDKVIKEATTGADGTFEIVVDPGEYRLEIAAPGFNIYTEMVQATPDIRPLSVTMELAQITQSVEVTETRNEISIDPDSSLTTTVLEREFIESLPDDEDELTGYLQQIAGSRGSAGGGVTFVIDGFNARLSTEALGLNLLAFMYIAWSDPKPETAFRERISRTPSVLECHHVTGEWNYLVKVRVRTTRDLEAFLADIKGIEGVQRTETVIVLSTLRETLAVDVNL